MSYLSSKFFLFVMCLVLLYYICPRKMRWIVLLSGSLVFYLSYYKLFLLFFLMTAVSTYLSGLLLEKHPAAKKWILLLCILLNVGYWFMAKNFNGYADLANRLFSFISIPNIKNIIIPLGISYYTLQAVAYVADIYRGAKAERNFFRYMLFLLWFPAIVQGPISRYGELAPQLFGENKFNYEKIRGSLLLILFGLIKKKVIADNLAIASNYIFDNFEALNFEGIILYLGAVIFSLQLYMDFSGCVDLCRGISSLFGVNLRQNFNVPYFSGSIKEFWGRWHMSLSAWLRDYVYIPLGGNRLGTGRKYLNIVLVFIVSAVWHGAGAVFLVWGLLHAFYQISGECTKNLRRRVKKLVHVEEGSASERIISIIITFNLVAFAWIFFRAPGMMSALKYVYYMLHKLSLWSLFDGTIYSLGLSEALIYLVLANILLVFIVDYLHYRGIEGLRERFQSLHLLIRWPVYLLMIFDLFVFGAYGGGINVTGFLYGGF